MYKVVLLSLFVLSASSVSFAQYNYQYSDPTLRTSTKQSQQNQSSSIFDGTSDFSYTQVNGNNNSGFNSTEWEPTLATHLGNLTLTAGVPFYWVSFQYGFNARLIGRPDFGGWMKYTNDNFRLDYGTDVRLPMSSASVTGVDSLRVFGVYPGYKATLNYPKSRVHLIQNTTVGVNSTASSTTYTDSTGSYSYQSDSPTVLYLTGGAGIDITSKAKLDLTLNFANGFGLGHSYYTSFQLPIQTQDRPAADLSDLKLSTAIDVARSSKLSAYVAVAMKDQVDHGTAGIQWDDESSFPSFGAGLGFSQAF